jgi:hypothetical protein
MPPIRPDVSQGPLWLPNIILLPCCKESREDASWLIRVILHLVEIDAKFFAVSSFADRVVDNYFVALNHKNLESSNCQLL